MYLLIIIEVSARDASRENAWNMKRARYSLMLNLQSAREQRVGMSGQQNHTRKKRKLRSTVVSEPGQIKANGPKFSGLETELHDLIFEELEIKDVLSLSLTNRYIWSVGRSRGKWLSHGPSQGSGAPNPCLLFLQILAS
jgi:hypothetical protein